MDNKNKKSNSCACIERVNDHNTTYRLKISDGSALELDKAEIGNFIPQKGMSVQIRLFNSLILQEVLLDGLVVLKRTPQKLMEMLVALSNDLQAAAGEFGRIAQLEDSEDYKYLPIVFQHRLKLLKLVMKKDFTADFLQRQIMVSQLAFLLSAQTNVFIAHFDRYTGNRLNDFKGALLLNDAEIFDTKSLALDFQLDKKLRFNSLRDFERSTVLCHKGRSTPYALRVEDAINRYVTAMLAG